MSRLRETVIGGPVSPSLHRHNRATRVRVTRGGAESVLPALERRSAPAAWRVAEQRAFGHTHAVDLLNPDYAALADAFGADYVRFGEARSDALRAEFAGSRVTLIEVEVGDSLARRRVTAVGRAKAAARAVAGRSVSAWVKERLGGE